MYFVYISIFHVDINAFNIYKYSVSAEFQDTLE